MKNKCPEGAALWSPRHSQNFTASSKSAGRMHKLQFRRMCVRERLPSLFYLRAADSCQLRQQTLGPGAKHPDAPTPYVLAQQSIPKPHHH